MIQRASQLELSWQVDGLRERLRAVGMPLLSCDTKGQLVALSSEGEDWLINLFVNAPDFKSDLKRNANSWSRQETPELSQSRAGIWLVPIPVINRRRCTGYLVAIIPTEPLLESGELERMACASGLTLEVCRKKLLGLPLASERDLGRLAAFVRYTCEDGEKIQSSQMALENVGQQLAETYEEINLLYTITQSITEVDRPERFVAFVCEELLATLPYTWIGVQLIDDPDRLKRLSGRMIVVGRPEQSTEILQNLSLELLSDSSLLTPMIIEPETNPKHAKYAPLGRTILAHPIKREESVIGLLIAGEKQGPDTTVSSVDVKLIGATASHMSIFLENAALYDDLSAMFLGTLEALTSAIDAKDSYTCGHSQRVAHLTQQLAIAAGMDEFTVNRMHIAGLVHDVGKIGVPEAVLTKPGRLTREEFDLIKLHPEIGYRILKDIPQLHDILPGVLHHHEAWSGKGYPRQLAGEDIPLVARLIALADSFDAMSSTRTYRAAMSRGEVLSEIERCTGTQFDPKLAPIFLGLDFSEYDRMAEAHSRREAELSEFGPKAA